MRAIEAQLEVLLRELDVAVATRDLPAARALLAAGEDCLGILDRDAGILSLEVGVVYNIYQLCTWMLLLAVVWCLLLMQGRPALATWSPTVRPTLTNTN